MNDLIGKLAAGAIRPLIHARLPLKDARRAHEMIEARAGDRQDSAEALTLNPPRRIPMPSPPAPSA